MKHYLKSNMVQEKNTHPNLGFASSGKAVSTARDEKNMFMAKTDEPSVRYESDNHIAIIFTMYASVWGQVLPYCLMMIILTITIIYTGKADILDLRINDKGHTFMSVMVSFLIISRSHVSLVRYMEARHFVGELMRCSREVIQHTVAFTRYERSKQARKWRAEIARRTCSLLRTVVVVLQHNKKREYVWQVAELTKAEKQALLLAVGGSNERSPLVLSIFIRTAIASHIESLESPLDVNVELKLLSFTSDFISAYHGLMKLLNTPYPFPMLQMTRTFLFVWVFTLPFALANDIISFVPLLLIVFFCTYGFIGLELISIALEDPFGDDPNDFDVKALAEVVYSDIYVLIEDIDGKDASNALRSSVEMPLRDQIKSAVKSHKPYSRLNHWGGKETNASIEKIAAKVSPILKMSSPTNLMIPSPKVSPSSTSIDYSGFSVSPTSRNAQNSKLLSSVKSQDSDTSIDVYGTSETVKFSYSRNILEVSSKMDDSLNTSNLNYSYQGQEETVFDTHIFEDATPILSIDSSSMTHTKNDSVVKALYSDSPWTGSSDVSDDCSASYDEFADSHSSLMSCIRQRCDTDASIEIYGSDQKVKYNASSNTIEVRKISRFATGDEVQPLVTISTWDKSELKLAVPDQEQSMDGPTKSLSVRNHPNKSVSRRPPNIPRQASFGKRKEIEKDEENNIR